jgi:class 3 adenylate cyclase
MRIGIHTGNIIGGVIGTDIVRYDIYGPDVLIANKMESNGEKGRIMISEETLKLINDNFGDYY